MDGEAPSTNKTATRWPGGLLSHTCQEIHPQSPQHWNWDKNHHQSSLCISEALTGARTSISYLTVKQ